MRLLVRLKKEKPSNILCGKPLYLRNTVVLFLIILAALSSCAEDQEYK